MKKTIAVFVLLAMMLGMLTVFACADNNEAVMECRNGVVRVVSVFPGGGIATGSALGVGDAGKVGRSHMLQTSLQALVHEVVQELDFFGSLFQNVVDDVLDHGLSQIHIIG